MEMRRTSAGENRPLKPHSAGRKSVLH